MLHLEWINIQLLVLFTQINKIFTNVLWGGGIGFVCRIVVVVERECGILKNKIKNKMSRHLLSIDEDIDTISDGIQKKVIVEVADGNKKVTVTTKEN